MDENARKADFLSAQIDKLARHMEAMNIAEYVELLQRPGRLLFINFLAGLARGLGIALGATLIFALTLEVMRRLIVLNIPGIGGFVAEVVRIVEQTNGKGRF